MHGLNLRAINPSDDSPAHRECDDEEIDEDDDGPFAGWGAGGSACVDGADTQHAAGNNETSTDHGRTTTP